MLAENTKFNRINPSVEQFARTIGKHMGEDGIATAGKAIACCLLESESAKALACARIFCEAQKQL